MEEMEQKDKLEQSAQRKWEEDQATNPTPVNPHAYVYGFKAGAQTILENPVEWELIAKRDVLSDIESLELEHKLVLSQLAKYREALERILQGNCSPTMVAKEALKQK